MFEILTKYKPLLLSCGAAMVLMLLRDVFKVELSEMAVSLFLCVIMVCLNFRNFIPFLFFLFPLTCGIPGYTMLGAFILLIIKGRKYNSRQVFPLLIVALLEFYSEIIGADMETFFGILSFLSFTALFFYFLNDQTSKIYNIPICILLFGIGTLFTFIVIFYNVIQSFGIVPLFSGMARSGALGVEGNDIALMKGHLAMNANTVAYYTICSIACLQTLLKYYRHKLYVIALIITILLCGVLSFSRTLILCLLILFIVYTMVSSKGLNIKFITLVGILFFIITYFAGSFLDTVYDSFADRINDQSFASASGRTIIFDEYNEKWIANLDYVIFGCGTVNARETLNVSNAMHSGLQQVWVSLGIIGLVLFIQQISVFILRYRRNNRFIFILPFIVTLLFDQSIQFLNPYPLMLPIVVSLLVWKENHLRRITL